MKIIEALKQIKHLEEKAQDYESKIKTACAIMDYESPTYEDQFKKVASWEQGHLDLLKEIGRLHYLIHYTNVHTLLTIKLNDKEVTKSISEWLFRRLKLISLEERLWSSFSDRGLREGRVKMASGDIRDAKIRRFYSPENIEKNIYALKQEKTSIDGALEIANATTDLIDKTN